MRGIGIGLLSMATLVTSCGGMGGIEPGASVACPETVSEASTTDGIDLATPPWLPGALLPDGASIRHLAHDTATGKRVLTAVVAGGLPEVLNDGFADAAMAGGYEILLAAAGFVPIGHEAVVVLDPGGDLMSFGATPDLAPVRNAAGDCHWADAALVSIIVDPVEPNAARATYAGSRLTAGHAVASIGDHRYQASGECLVLDRQLTFGSTDPGVQVGLQFETTNTGTSGFANAGIDGADTWTLDLDRSPGPEFRTTVGGFAVQGTFIDAWGDEGRVMGTVEVTCP